jgi:hypothetical protein
MRAVFIRRNGMKKKQIQTRGGLVLISVLFAATVAQGAAWTWTNENGDNVFTNEANWISEGGVHEFPSNETMVVSLSGADKAILSEGMETPNMDGIRVSYVAGDVGEVLQTGGIMNLTALTGRETVVGHVGTGYWTMTGGEAYLNNMTIGAGSGTGTLTISNGVMEFASTYNGGSIIIGTESATSTGTVNVVGGVIKTAYGINLGSNAEGSSTFHLNGGGGVVSNGVLNNAVSGYWYQDATSTLKATIDSDDGFSLGQIVISGGTNDTPAVTFKYGATIDIAFSGDDMGDEIHSWDLITWPTNTVVDDGGLNFDTNNVDISKWSFAITNNALRVTYGMGSEVVVISNPPPTSARTLYWTGNGSDNNATNAANWSLDTTGTNTASWGVYADDTIYVGQSSVNEETFVSECTIDGLYFENQTRLYIGNNRTGIVNFVDGAITLPKPSGSARSSYIGWGGTEGVGTLNIDGGVVDLYATELGQSGAQGTINLNDGSLLLSGRIASTGLGTDGRASLWIGGATSGSGTVNISGGQLQTLIGVVLGNDSGVGTFHVNGSGASLIDLGSTRTTYDGFWHQNAGSTLKVTIDEGGVTPINVREDGNTNGGERTNLTDVVFAEGSILDVDWADGVTHYGAFDIMTFGGSVSNGGLAFASTVDTDIWEFSFVDTDGDSSNDTLRVTAPKGTTANGTPLWWLYSNGLTEADDELDADNDGMDNWQEYVAGTSPTNSTSVLEVNAFNQDGTNYVLSWQSVAGKSYSVVSGESVVSMSGVEASGIAGADGETSHTGTVSSSDTVFYKVEVQ